MSRSVGPGAGPRAPGGPGPRTIHVRARLFAMQREAVGARSVDLELPEGSDVEAAWSALVVRHPVLAPGRSAVRFARNGDYADPADLLADGDELACIPPVSGGAGTGPVGEIVRIIELREKPFGLGILAELATRLASDEDGAIVGFIGQTRRTPGTPAPGQEHEAERHAGRDVEALEYEAHEIMARRVLTEIAEEAERRFGVRRLAVVHRLGRVDLGEPSVAVVAASPHRDAAFLAARYAIDETKARVPIWKAERFADGHVWIGEPARTAPPEDG